MSAVKEGKTDWSCIDRLTVDLTLNHA